MSVPMSVRVPAPDGSVFTTGAFANVVGSQVPVNLADLGATTAVLKSAAVTGDGTWADLVFEVDAEPVFTQTLEIEVAPGSLRAPAGYSLTDPVGPSLRELAAKGFCRIGPAPSAGV